MTSKGKRRCRRSCPTLIPRWMAFCGDCWPKIPNRFRRRILSSWEQVKADPDHLYVHVGLLMRVEEAIEGDREWESVEA